MSEYASKYRAPLVRIGLLAVLISWETSSSSSKQYYWDGENGMMSESS